MARVRRYCGNYLYDIEVGRNREYCGNYLHGIDGPLSHMDLMALIAVLFA